MILWHLNYSDGQGGYKKGSSLGYGTKKNFTSKEDALYFISQHTKKHSLCADVDKLESIYRLVSIDTNVCLRHEQMFPERERKKIEYKKVKRVTGAGNVSHA